MSLTRRREPLAAPGGHLDDAAGPAAGSSPASPSASISRDAADRGQRRAQLVADRGDELLLHRVQPLVLLGDQPDLLGALGDPCARDRGGAAGSARYGTAGAAPVRTSTVGDEDRTGRRRSIPRATQSRQRERRPRGRAGSARSGPERSRWRTRVDRSRAWRRRGRRRRAGARRRRTRAGRRCSSVVLAHGAEGVALVGDGERREGQPEQRDVEPDAPRRCAGAARRRGTISRTSVIG